MKKNVTVLIVMDEAESVQKIALEIESFLDGNKVLRRSAAGLSPTDLLTADVCFFGCEKPKPPSFAELEHLLLHINLARRSCGLFTSGQKNAADYLKKMVGDSELDVSLGPYVAGQSQDLKKWTMTVLNGK